MGYVYVLCGSLMFLAAVPLILIGIGTSAEGGAYGISLGIGLLLGGLVIVGFGELVHCIRDIARNSFFLRTSSPDTSGR